MAEYDAAGNIVWQWKTSHYFEESDLKYYVSRNNRPIIDLFHENSFYFDEQNQIIYISVKYLNRIIKIKYPEGTVLNNYGELFNPGVSNADNHMFCDQHSIRPGQDGYIYLFNNNVCNPGSYPSVIKFKEPQTANEHLNKVWEYECASKEHGPEGYPSGGNVLELPDKSVFISTAGPDNKILIVKPDKTHGKLVGVMLGRYWYAS